jgi:5-methylcytosine-specific restriction endonuclease McrA
MFLTLPQLIGSYGMAEDKVQGLSLHEKRKARGRAYYWAHREERLAYGAAYYAENKAAALAYYHANKGKARKPKVVLDDEQFLALRRPQKRVSHQKSYQRLKNEPAFLQKKQAKDKKYRSTHKEQRRLAARLRRAHRKKCWIHDLTDVQWEEILQAYHYRCVYCDRKFRATLLTREHLTPVSKGGAHTVVNVVPACLSCNARRGNRKVLKPVQPLLLTLA